MGRLPGGGPMTRDEFSGKKLGEIWPLSDFVKAKARKYFTDGSAVEEAPGTWTVKGTGDRPYIVQTDGRKGHRYLSHIICTCEHGKHTSGRARCSHAVAVAMVIVDSMRKDQS